ncbi:MAG: ABC transporter ATP-binding protein [Ruminococcus sp.]|nr:ABC transporter ATP-binding protein [Ruminococcus sp.]
MFKLIRYLRLQEWLMLILSLVLMVCQVWLDLKIPDYMSEITMYVQTETGAVNDILRSGGMMLLCAFGSLLFAFVSAFITARIASNFSAVVRKALFYKVQEFTLSEINSFSTASLITRSTNDITHVQMLLAMGIQVIFKTPIMAGIALSKISGKCSEWSFTTASAVIILLILVITTVALTLKKFKKLQYLTDRMNLITRENLNGIQVLRAYNAEKYRSNVFDGVNSELTETNMYTNIVMSFLNPGINLIMSGLTLAIYWVGAGLIDRAEDMERMTIFSDMIVYSSYAMQIVSAFMMLVMVFIILPRALVSAKRVSEVLNQRVSLKEGNVTDGEKTASVEFRNVSFRYPESENDVLTDISFTAEKGETIAIIGSTGCGKTTLVNLIMRFYDATEGEVFVNGVNVKDYKKESLCSKIGYVPQKAFLFSGTVASNIVYGSDKEVDKEWLEQSAKISYVSEFTDKMRDGIESVIARKGANISGGQKQRVSIARAVYKKPEILIFDDSFSALDYKTDKLVRSALKEKYCDSIKLIVAQRIGTICEADKIIVLDDGKIAGIGTHETLMTSCKVYQQIASTQLSGGAVENEKK